VLSVVTPVLMFLRNLLDLPAFFLAQILFQRDMVVSEGGAILRPEMDGAGDAGLESGNEGDDVSEDSEDGPCPAPCRALTWWCLSPNSSECSAIVQGVVEPDAAAS